MNKHELFLNAYSSYTCTLKKQKLSSEHKRRFCFRDVENEFLIQTIQEKKTVSRPLSTQSLKLTLQRESNSYLTNSQARGHCMFSEFISPPGLSAEQY
jgi:hypothetical protein